MAGNNLSGYTYYAFISYKREDEKLAKWLQKKLESYGFPVALRKDNPWLPSKIRPIFRDQSELSGGNLKEEIEKGLKGSKYLIVICSPRAAQSPWVSKEVQYFIDNGKENNIIPFIIGGIPNAKNPEEECFPEGLRQLSGEKEILGININEMGRDAAAIKVIARMFDLRFDALWQRHERAKRQRLTGWGIVAAVIIASITGVAIFINSQNLELKQANNTIKAERDRANEQTKIAEKERDNALKANKSLEIANDSIKRQTTEINKANLNLQNTNKQLSMERNRANSERDHVLRANDSIKKQIQELIDVNQHLGLIYKDSDKLEEALDYYTKASDYRMKLHGKSPADSTLSLINIAYAHMSQGDYAYTIENLVKALEVNIDGLGENSDVASLLSLMGDLCGAQGDYHRALEYYEKSLNILLNTVGENHADVTTVKKNISKIIKAMEGE